jgi:outer membrane lipoprotein-sorting protein
MHTMSRKLMGLALGVFFLGGSVGSTQEKKQLSPDEIIQAFSAKETEFYEAWKQYTYRQVADIKVVSVDGRPSRERMVMISEVVFDDKGNRDIKIVERSGRLRSVGWTEEDSEVIHNLQPFALTAKELTSYNLKYEGKERIDELSCYVFSVKPKSTRGADLGRFFDGKIYVDDQDLQVVRTVGKAVPQSSQNQFPEFETLRQTVDNQYWFPVWTHADSRLHFPGQTVRVEETITYEGYKRFGSKATIDFSTVPAPPKPEKPPEKPPQKPPTP